MGLNYFKNYLGFTLSEEQFEDIPFPLFELTSHVTIKSVQAFGLLGTALVGPIAALPNKATRNIAGIVAKSTKFGRAGAFLGVPAGPLMTYAVIRKATDESIVDRCFRLRHNRGQVHVDQASVLGAGCGAVAASALKAQPTFGLLVGMSSGIIGAAVYNSKVSKK